MKDLVGQTLGYYRIEASLGFGGMGQVFRGKHIYLDRSAAIKVMHEHLTTNEMFRMRFIQEAKSTAALKHPHIVEIYEFGEQDGLILYLVMELLTEGTLSTLIREHAGQQSEPEKQTSQLIIGLDLVRQAAEGLAVAHAQGIIHRDIKPDNLLIKHLGNVDQKGEQYQLKISDFGLARLAENSNFSSGGPVGTPAYMSPEQCLNQKLDGRSDLYSLGVVLYEVVTGSLPFQINTFSEAVHKHVHIVPLQGGESPPLQQVRPGLPPIIEQIILRCLAKAPEERYQTGNELAEALNEAISQISSQVTTSLVAPYKVPRIRIFQGGQPLKTVEMIGQRMLIGRQNDCDIILSAEAISRRHLEVQWDGKHTTVADLRSSNGTRLGNDPLPPFLSRVWNEQQTISIGPFSLRLEEGTNILQEPFAKGGTGQGSDEGQGQHPQGGHSVIVSDRIGIRVEPEKLTITPGQPSTARVTLVNLGQTSDWFTPVIEGVAAEWAQGQGRSVHLNPGKQEDIDLQINVSKRAENIAQEYPVTIRVNSREKPNEWGLALASWTVLPFWDEGVIVQPPKVTGQGTGNYTVTVRNNGNISENYELSGEDNRKQLTYQFNPSNKVTVEPGEQTNVSLQVKTRRVWIGKEQLHLFLIRARPATKRNHSGQAEMGTTPVTTFVNRALIPNKWFILMIALLLICVVSLIVSLTFFTGGTGASVTSPTPTPRLPTPTAIFDLDGGIVNTMDDQSQSGGQPNQFNYIGNGWSHCSNCGPDFYHGTNSWSNTPNDSMIVTFTGTQIKFYSVCAPSHGIGALSIDGGKEKLIDFYRANRVGNQPMWTSEQLPLRQHTLKLRITGTKNVLSTDRWVVVDRVDIDTGVRATPTSVK